MSILSLVKHFDHVDRPLGIKIEDISKKILSLVSNHAIFYCDQPDRDGCELLGMFEQRERQGVFCDDPGINNYIHYKKNLSLPYRRLVMGKELIHVLDPDCYLTKTETDVKSLTVDFATPVSLRGKFPHARHDYSAIILALGLFLPLSIRGKLLEDYNSEKLDSTIIANKISIPEAYVEVVMSENWPDFYMDTLKEAEEQFS